MTSLAPNRCDVPTSRKVDSSCSIQIEKEAHKFSAAHFLIFPDGSAERLHGHNYRVAIEIESPADAHGLVIDFRVIKPIIREILEGLDERVLIPGLHPDLTCSPTTEAGLEIRYRDRRYVIPRDEVVVLPISNTSSENLARWIAEELADSVQRDLSGVELAALRVSVEETAGQRGIVTLTF